jgi:predicted regulator of amino acid metabolism with ACT domain
MTDTTTIAAESFLTEQTEVEAILSAAGVLGVELKLVNNTVTATGKVSRLDPYLKRRIAKAKEEIKIALEAGAETLTIAHETAENSTSWEEVETALALVIDAVNGRVIGYDDAAHFVEQAKHRARFIPAAGAIGG